MEQATAVPGNGLPLDPLSAASGALGARRLAQITWALLLIGIAARLVRFLLRFPLWPDEAFLAHSYLGRGYLDLLHPLDFAQVAPLLYLWIQLTFIKLLGFSEYSLRIYALVCGLLSLLVFRRLAGRLLGGATLALALGTFAVAYPLVRYSAEAKPYGSDMFVSLVLLTLAVEWYLHPRQWRWTWALAIAMPLALALSYPAAFTAGGISLAMAGALWQLRTRATTKRTATSGGYSCGTGSASVPLEPHTGGASATQWLGWVACNATLCGGFAALFALSAGRQLGAAGDAMRGCWSQLFPPLTSPGPLALFLLDSHASDALAYPVGGSHGASILTLICCLTALVLLLRRGRPFVAGLLLGPLALHFLAAAMRFYPYGGHVRFHLYLGAMFCLAAALGAAAILAALGRSRPARPVLVAALLLGVIGLGAVVRDFFKPYKETCFMRNRDFARWFWFDKAIDAELVCVNTDLGQSFYAPRDCDDMASLYFCNQRIYSPRHARGEPYDLARVSAARPLRCVRFRPTAFTRPADEAAFATWLAQMQRDYRLVAQESHLLPFFHKERELLYVDHLDVYEFVPRPDLKTAGEHTPRVCLGGVTTRK